MLSVPEDAGARWRSIPTGPGNFGVGERGIIALVNPERLRRILTKMLDEKEFLSPYGIRSLSKFHQEHPYVFHVQGQDYRVDYLPGESDTGMFGGNSNWRGPIWMPVNTLIIRALLNFYLYYGDNFKIECPTGSGRMMNLFEVAQEITDRLRGSSSGTERAAAVYGGTAKFQEDPHWRDHRSSTNTSTGTTGRASAQVTRLAGPGMWPNYPTLRPAGREADPEGGKKAAFKKATYERLADTTVTSMRSTPGSEVY